MKDIDYNWKDNIIVVVEDIEVNFVLIKRLLRKTNASVVWLKNGQESVDYVNENKPATLILMDIRMPIMDGITATKMIKQQKPDLPIIIQTACVIGSDFEEVESSGCDDYMFKPIIAQDFYPKIDQYIIKNDK